MDPVTLLHMSHVEQRIAREQAALHNAAARLRRDRRARRRLTPTSRLTARRSVGARPVCTTC